MDKKPRIKVDEIAKDWISNLPDEIIQLIWSLMPIKEAGKTSVLSHRWSDLWNSSMSIESNVKLDSLNIMGNNYSERVFRMKSRMTIAEKRVLQKERQRFVRRAGMLLQQYRSPVLNSFKIRFHMDNSFSDEIDRWIQLAITKRAMKIDINLSEFEDYRHLNPNLDELYAFPCWVFPNDTSSFLKYMSLCNCICVPPADFIGFQFLIELRLETVYLYDGNIEYILSTSSCLERLSLIDCWKLGNLKIVGENLVLKYLIVAECYSLEKIEINAPNLMTFEYTGIPVGLDFQNVPQLENVVIYTVQKDIVAGTSYTLGALSTDVPHIKALLLHADHIERKIIPKQLPTFSNLKQLVLMLSWVKGSLFGFLTVLQTTPHLERFELHLPFCAPTKRIKKVKKPSKWPLPLKEIIFSGLVGSQDEVDFANHLVTNAEGIKVVTIFSIGRTYWYDRNLPFGNIFAGSFMDVVGGTNKDSQRMAAELVGRKIEKVLPPRAELIIT